jgi:plasmid maintenance system antidote protein VapI
MSSQSNPPAYADDDLLAELEGLISQGSQAQAARALGVSQQFVCDVVRRRRPITRGLALKLGYERRVYYVRAEDAQ